ncbi:MULTISPECIES: TetR family transcriptional regulator [Pimelobacter]|uniref:TetR family transcriptional regulator n=1 Tax=Pimelobacter TaxID=2044 RepID=UPI001C05E245|nr:MULTISPECIES: TetR family transcriptional regulator [Pimelobacter]MBU2696411.1 TetR family transcriptional regulator [Pimelobacter sp. 30-1]UUW87862.1 TetR family transcriptional regulator [Pimelobacter simplex]UUW97367.1 TetR family transcriptional regulator [Pimelobacter simplex]
MTIANPSTSDDLGSAAQRERRKRILDATYELAKSGGFDAVQMRAVAEHADVALGTLYRYFPSKIHLLVSALGRQFDEAATRLNEREIPGDNQADRVLYVLKRMARGMQGDPKLTEALTRAFMFADSSVAAEIHVVGMAMTSIVTHAMHGGEPSEGAVSDEDVAVARVIGDVWLSALVSWVTGRSTAAETAQHMETAIHLILRD